MKREKEIIKVSIYGILVNLILVGFKVAVDLKAEEIRKRFKKLYPEYNVFVVLDTDLL